MNPLFLMGGIAAVLGLLYKTQKTKEKPPSPVINDVSPNATIHDDDLVPDDDTVFRVLVPDKESLTGGIEDETIHLH